MRRTQVHEIGRRWIDDSGAAYVYVALIFASLVGAMALSIDGGRLFTLNSQLQDAADAAAIAGAAELDGSLGARARATLAAQTGLQGTLRNGQTFATDGLGQVVDISSEPGAILFLRRLPPDDQEITVVDLATSDGDARFIRVTVEPRVVDNWLSRPLRGLAPWTTQATATAGFTQAVCRFPPLFMCNPFESTSFPTARPDCPTGAGAPFDESCLPDGAQVLLKTAGQGADYVPGDFGLLDPPLGNQGAINVANEIAVAEPRACFSSMVNLRTGEAMGPVRSALNVRFDIYENPGFGNKKNDPDYRPALDVTKGHIVPPNEPACNSEIAADPTVARGFPQDNCFVSGTCSGGNRFGDGNWDRDAYWAVNHPGTTDPKPFGYSNMSRYDVYRHEVENSTIPDNSPNGENGHPQCYSGGQFSDPSSDPDDVGSDEIDRRILTLAVINCVAQGPITGNSAGSLPVERFAKIFLTQPAQGQGNDQADIYAEIIGVLNPGEQNGELHDMVQLYR